MATYLKEFSIDIIKFAAFLWANYRDSNIINPVIHRLFSAGCHWIKPITWYDIYQRTSTVRFYFVGRKTKNEKTFKLNFYSVIVKMKKKEKKKTRYKPVTEKLKAGC